MNLHSNVDKWQVMFGITVARDAGCHENGLRSVASDARIKAYYMCMQKKSEEATAAAGNVYEELKKQVALRRLKLSRDEGGKEGKSTGFEHKQMDDERHELLSEKRLGTGVPCKILGRRLE